MGSDLIYSSTSTSSSVKRRIANRTINTEFFKSTKKNPQKTRKAKRYLIISPVHSSLTYHLITKMRFLFGTWVGCGTPIRHDANLRNGPFGLGPGRYLINCACAFFGFDFDPLLFILALTQPFFCFCFCSPFAFRPFRSAIYSIYLYLLILYTILQLYSILLRSLASHRRTMTT